MRRAQHTKKYGIQNEAVRLTENETGHVHEKRDRSTHTKHCGLGRMGQPLLLTRSIGTKMEPL